MFVEEITPITHNQGYASDEVPQYEDTRAFYATGRKRWVSSESNCRNKACASYNPFSKQVINKARYTKYSLCFCQAVSFRRGNVILMGTHIPFLWDCKRLKQSAFQCVASTDVFFARPSSPIAVTMAIWRGGYSGSESLHYFPL